MEHSELWYCPEQNLGVQVLFKSLAGQCIKCSRSLQKSEAPPASTSTQKRWLGLHGFFEEMHPAQFWCAF